MTAQKGKDLLLKLDETGGGTFVTVAGLRATRLSFNSDTVDVTTAESGSPVSHAAVFLELEHDDGEERKSEWILALTDEQGGFEISDPPAGLYRLSVYAPPREIEIGGVELGATGTIMLPVRLPPV